MFVKSLQLKDYYMFSDNQIELCYPHKNENVVNIIIGANGTGKTKLLEFLYNYLITGCLPSEQLVKGNNPSSISVIDWKGNQLNTANEIYGQFSKQLFHKEKALSGKDERIYFVRSMLQSEPQQALGELQRVEELAKETGKNIRNMLFTLRPLVLETQGLGAAIETIMERTKDENSPAMRMVGGEHGELLNPRAQGVLFYMIEEALGNARKHSRANLIEVRFWQEGGLFVARVQDDGVGFEVDEVMGDYSSRGSLGMINLRERAENIDASLNIESVVGKGTAITIVVPLDKQGASKTAAKQPAKGRR